MADRRFVIDLCALCPMHHVNKERDIACCSHPYRPVPHAVLDSLPQDGTIPEACPLSTGELTMRVID